MMPLNVAIPMTVFTAMMLLAVVALVVEIADSWYGALFFLLLVGSIGWVFMAGIWG